MDPAAIVGLVMAMGAIFGAMIMEGGSPAAIFLPAPLVLVFVGTLGASLAGGTLPAMMSAFKWLIFSFTAKRPDHESVIGPLVKLAEKARREGLLALESEMDTVDDTFMRRGLQMAVDGTDPDDLYEILSAEVKAQKAGAAVGAGFWTDAGGYAPTVGIIGTVIGLIHVLENLSEPEKLGHLIAGAFVATLWGVLSANVLWLPIASRLKRLSEVECQQMEVALEGVLAIQSGTSPRVVAERLTSLLPPGTMPEQKAA